MGFPCLVFRPARVHGAVPTCGVIRPSPYRGSGFLSAKLRGDLMTRIIVIGICLALVVGVMAADAQGVGYPPGVNPSNPQDLTYRSNPQDLTVPGGNNRQDLVRRPPGGSVPL